MNCRICKWKRRPNSCLWGRFQHNGFYSLQYHLPSTFHQTLWLGNCKFTLSKIVLLNLCSNIQNKKVQWIAINSPSDRHKDRNEALTQELKNTVIHIYSFLVLKMFILLFLATISTLWGHLTSSHLVNISSFSCLYSSINFPDILPGLILFGD